MNSILYRWLCCICVYYVKILGLCYLIIFFLLENMLHKEVKLVGIWKFRNYWFRSRWSWVNCNNNKWVNVYHLFSEASLRVHVLYQKTQFISAIVLKSPRYLSWFKVLHRSLLVAFVSVKEYKWPVQFRIANLNNFTKYMTRFCNISIVTCLSVLICANKNLLEFPCWTYCARWTHSVLAWSKYNKHSGDIICCT